MSRKDNFCNVWDCDNQFFYFQEAKHPRVKLNPKLPLKCRFLCQRCPYHASSHVGLFATDHSKSLTCYRQNWSFMRLRHDTQLTTSEISPPLTVEIEAFTKSYIRSIGAITLSSTSSGVSHCGLAIYIK